MGRPTRLPKSLPEALAALGSRDSRKVANNTYLIRTPEGAAVKLHATNVVTFLPEGVRLDSGGWRTPVTRDRINECLPSGWRLWQDGGLWTAYPPRPEPDGYADLSRAFPYAERMTLLADGSVRYDGEKPNPEAEKKLRAAVRAYAKGYVAALLAGKIPPPSLGDCWGCAMRYEDDEKVRSERTGPMGSDHIREHIREKYFVPSLAFNALKAAGAGPYYASATFALMQGKAGEHDGGILAPTLRRAIARYIYLNLGLAR